MSLSDMTFFISAAILSLFANNPSTRFDNAPGGFFHSVHNSLISVGVNKACAPPNNDADDVMHV